MKLRVIFLRKKQIISIFLILIFLVAVFILAYSKKCDTTFSTIGKSRILKYDVTGDGVKDTIGINTIQGMYSIDVISGDKKIKLTPDSKLKTLGKYSKEWPMRLTLIDISRNRIPEIIVQSSDNNKALQHIFLFQDGQFKDIFSNSNSILGIIDCQNNRTPKVISAKYSSYGFDFSNYILIGGELQKYTCDIAEDYMGKSTILKLISYIQALPRGEIYKPKDIFDPGLKGSELAIIGKMAAENNIYTFQDAFFEDIKYDKDGETIEVSWILNFKGININTNEVKNYTLNVLIKKIALDEVNYKYKIYYINLT
jgi:hypothetical protein